MSKYTRKGRQEATISPTLTSMPGITLVRGASGEVTGYNIDTNKLPVPERTYRASTGSYEVTHSECVLNFAQFRVGSKSRLQSAVAVVLPLSPLRELKFDPAIGVRIEAAARGGTFPRFPVDLDEGDYQSITYEAQLIRLLINEKFGYAIDFYQIPIEMSPATIVNDVIRITTSPSLFATVARWLIEVAKP